MSRLAAVPDATPRGRGWKIGASRLGWAAFTAFSVWGLVILLLFGSPFPTSVLTRWGQDIILAAFAVPGWVSAVARPRRVSLLLLVAVALPLATSVVASLISPYPSISWPATLRLLSGEGCLLLFVALASNPVGRRHLITTIGALAVIGVAVYLWMVLTMWREWLDLGLPLAAIPLRPANRGGILPIPTWFGDMALMTVPLTAYAAWRRGGSWKAFACGLVVATAVALLITGTRSLWLFAAVVWLIGAIALSRRRISPVAIAIAVVIGVAAASQTTLLSQSIRSLDEGRISAYRSAFNQFASSPILGVGQGLYPLRRLAEPIDPLAYLAFPSAHNVIFNTAAETGLVGLVALLAAAALAGVVLRRQLTAWNGDGRFALVCALSLLPVILHALVDVVFEVPGLLVLATAVGGLALAPSLPIGTPDGSQSHGDNGRVAGGLVTVLSVAGLLVVAKALPVEASISDLVGAGDSTRPPEARIALAASAATRTPDLGPAWTAQAVTNDAVNRGSEAQAASSRAASLDPLAQHEMSLALIAARSGDASAVTAMRSAMTHGRLDPMVQLNAAVFFAEHDLPEEGRHALTEMLVDDPMLSLVADALPPIASQMLPRARRAAVDHLIASSTRPTSALLIAVIGGDPSLAQDVVARFDAAGDPAGRWLLRAWGGDQAAIASLDDAVRQDPHRQDLMFDRWLVATRECDVQGRTRWATAFRLAFGQSPVVPTALGQVPDIAGARWPVTYPGAVWGFSLPEQPYPRGTWNYRIGVPDCAR